jgi:hypothetical protein
MPACLLSIFNKHIQAYGRFQRLLIFPFYSFTEIGTPILKLIATHKEHFPVFLAEEKDISLSSG